MSTFSLLYPQGYEKQKKTSLSDLSFYTKLGLDRLVRIPIKGTLPWVDEQEQFAQLLTSDAEVIQYRLDVVEDLINNPKLCETLTEVLPQIETIAQLRADKGRVSDITACLYSISEIELYTDCVDLLYNSINNAKPASTGLTTLLEMIQDVYNSEEYQKLKRNAKELMEQTRSIRSVTIGVNLNPQLQAVEAGVVAVNSEFFRSGDIIDRILRLDRADDGFRCLTPLIPYGQSRADQTATVFNSAVNHALDQIFRSTVRSWRPIIRRYLAQNTDYLVNLAKEIRLLLGAVEFTKKMRSLGMPMCKPEVYPLEAKVFAAKTLYNPHVALSLGKENADEMVFNDFEFDQNGMIYILTGANQGGKTAITYAVGIVQALFQLGFFVPARSAKLSPVDNLLIHFPSTGAAVGKGRLGEECDHLRQILSRISEYSMVLMDEAFSSTSAVEASYIAGEVLLGISLIGARGIFATHLHDLAQQVDRLNAHGGNKAMLDNLVAEVESESTKRTFKISRIKPDGLSYARSIAEQYGITLEQILENRRSKRGS